MLVVCAPDTTQARAMVADRSTTSVTDVPNAIEAVAWQSRFPVESGVAPSAKIVNVLEPLVVIARLRVISFEACHVAGVVTAIVPVVLG